MAKKISLFPILLVNFIGTLGFSLVMPFLVFLVTKFGGNAQIYGLLGAAYPAFQLIGAPILGKWSDIYGRKKILLLSQAGTLLSLLIFLGALLLPITTLLDLQTSFMGEFLVTVPLLVLFLARALDGLTGGNIFQGAMNLNQLFCFRPVMGWADHHTPVEGLYLCGAASHPGGGVMGACGMNAAVEILREALDDAQREIAAFFGESEERSPDASDAP